MLLVQNHSFQSLPPSFSSKSTVYFFVYAANSSSQDPIKLTLQRGSQREATLRVTNQQGEAIFQAGAATGHYTLQNLVPGTYFFEINDGFYCQIKELAIG